MSAGAKQANKEFLAALKYARGLVEPKPAHQKLADARALARVINRGIMHLTDSEQDQRQLNPYVEDDLQPTMQALSEVLKEQLEPLGFCLLVFGFGETPTLNYSSNARRDDMLRALSELQAAMENDA